MGEVGSGQRDAALRICDGNWTALHTLKRSGTAVWKAAVYSRIFGNIVTFSNPLRLRLYIPPSGYDLASLWAASIEFEGVDSTGLQEVGATTPSGLESVGVVAKHD